MPRKTILMLASTSRCLQMPLWPFLAAAALFGTFSGPQHLTQESHPETGRRSARARRHVPPGRTRARPRAGAPRPSLTAVAPPFRCRYWSSSGGGCTEACVYGTSDGFCDDGGPGAEYSLCSLGTDCTDCGSRSSTYLTPPLAPSYSAPPGVTAAHALALAATGMMCLIFFVAGTYESSPSLVWQLVWLCLYENWYGKFVVICGPFVLALPLALQLGMPGWIFDIDVVICIAAAGFGLYGFFVILCSRDSSISENSFIFGSASLALLLTALNALLPAAAVYTLLPLVWAVCSGFAISGWLACEKEGVGSACARSFFGQFLAIVGSVVTLPLAVLPWVEAMPGGLFDALWFACAAMALVHLSMAFWLSDGKPHIVVAWVSSAMMGLALLEGVVTVAPPAVWALSPSPPPSPPAPPLPPSAPSYSAPPGVTAAHALALAATGMMCLIFFVAGTYESSPSLVWQVRGDLRPVRARLAARAAAWNAGVDLRHRCGHLHRRRRLWSLRLFRYPLQSRFQHK